MRKIVDVIRHIRKGYCSLNVGLAEQVSIVEALQESHSVTMLCEAFGLHKSTLNYRRTAAKRINPETVKLNAIVRGAHNDSNGSAGAGSIANIVTGA